MDPAALQNIVQQAVQAAVAAAVAAPNNAVLNQHIQQLVQAQLQQQQQNPPPAVFLINPAGAGNAAWDLMSSTGLKIYMAAITALTPLFDGEEVDLNAFLRKVWLRAEAFGFTGVLVVQDAEQTPRNITREFGCLTLAQVQPAAIVDIQAADRRTQAQELLRQLIQASCTPRIVDRLEHRKDDYMVDVAQPGNPAEVRFSGSCLLFSLIGMVSVQTRATVSSLMNVESEELL
jgi:hypothetical protein